MDAELDAAELSALWDRRWPGCRPIGHELRSAIADRWVRFHSLPDTKRYATTPDEHAEVLRRHHCLLADLRAETGGSQAPSWVFTASYSESPIVEPRAAELIAAMPDASHWQSFDYVSEPAMRSWIHVWASRVTGSTGLAALLLLVARDGAREVIIADSGLAWLYHPYDGGGDVIAPTQAVRDELRRTHEAWLSPHPRGL